MQPITDRVRNNISRTNVEKIGIAPMDVLVVSFREGRFPISTDQYGGNLRFIANEPNIGEHLSGVLPQDVLILHKDPRPITESRFAELINHFGGATAPNAPHAGFVQIGKHHNDRVDLQLGEVDNGTAPPSQAILASFSDGIASEIRSAVSGSIYRSVELLSAPAKSFNLILDQKLSRPRLLRALRSKGWITKNSYFTAYMKAIKNQNTYRVVAYIRNRDDVEQIVMTFPGIADGEHARFHNVELQDLIRGIYSAVAKDEERQPLLTTQA